MVTDAKSERQNTSEERAGIVYALGCGDCASVYIGETSRTAKQQIKEHWVHIKHWRTEMSAVAAHAFGLDHQIHWQPRIIKKKEVDMKKRKI